MTSNLLSKWLIHYDPIHRGWSPIGIANGLCATGGFFFPRVRGGYNLYRSLDGVPSVPLEPVGAADADAVEIRAFPWVGHAQASNYLYQLVPVGGGGVENRTDAARTVVRFTETGLWTGLLPDPPADLQVVALGYGRFAVRWSYDPQDRREQAHRAVAFNVYKSYGHDEIDYASSEAQVACRCGQVHYEYVSPPEPDGTRVNWAVRASAASFREEQNRVQVSGIARALSPPADPVVRIAIR